MGKEEKLFLSVKFQLVSVKGMVDIFLKIFVNLYNATEIIKAKNHQWMLKSSIQIRYLHSHKLSPYKIHIN